MLKTNRKSDYPIHDLLLNRWSPRAFSQELVTDEELMTLFEAARWAPSSYNNQPWRFLYARNGSSSWPLFFNLLVPGNQLWAKDAQVLILVASKKNFEKTGKPSRTHSFDTGAAALNMQVQAASMGIVAHGMEGFDYERARKELAIPDDYDIEAMFAIGKIGDKDSLPDDIRAREIPSSRKPLNELVFEGLFPR